MRTFVLLCLLALGFAQEDAVAQTEGARDLGGMGDDYYGYGGGYGGYYGGR